jgi:hypothetical protein
MKHNIFTTYSASPIKNVKTPIRKFNDETEEAQAPVENTVATADATIVILEQIRALLLVMIIIKVLCLCFKK